jgi:3-isopropylmalate/(R)-2-methylmalate dehydratase large subunit
MGFTYAEKALARAAGLDFAIAGQIVDARPDVALSHDNTAPIARIFREIGATRVRHPERLAITLDHAVPAPTTQHAQNHAEIRRFVAEQGIEHFFEAGRGICHQVVSEEALIWPGQLILGSDSHTTHFGWLGAYGAGVGRSEMAAIWATGELWLRVPETIRIDLVGALPPGVTAKDLSLWVLRQLGPDAGIYTALEFGGPGLASLSLESRMVIPNMMAEAGAKNAYLEPDGAVFDWLARHLVIARGRTFGEAISNVGRDCFVAEPAPRNDSAAAWAEHFAANALCPDPDATYLARYTLDLSALEPLVARPHNPANVVPLSQVGGVHVDQAFLGTCTNGRLEDLAAAAAVLRAADGTVRRVAPGTRLLVIPASSQVLQDALAAGHIRTFLAAGAMIGTPGCGPCMGNHMGVPAQGEVTISSANRNFNGRMGTPGSEVYLASPAVVAASAVLGRIADPRELEAGNWKLESGSSKLEAGNWKLEAGLPAPRALKLEAGHVVDSALPATNFRQPAFGNQPPATSLQQPASGHQLPATSFRPPASGHQPPATSLQPPASGHQLPATSLQPPASSHQLPATSLQQPASGNQLPATSFRPPASGHQLPVSGRAWVYGDNVNTDVIFPGKYTYTISDPAEMARHALEDLDPTFAGEVRQGDIIVAGRNWGCGSSREQAATCLRAAGVRAIIAASFARIFFRNAVNNGVLPIACPEAAAAIRPGEAVTVDVGRCVVRCEAGEFGFPPLSGSLRHIVEAGGLVPMLKQALAQHPGALPAATGAEAAR